MAKAYVNTGQDTASASCVLTDSNSTTATALAAATFL